MKKIVYICIILVFSGINSLAQKSKDVLYLKNGSVINGTLFEISDNSVKIRTSDKSIFVYNTSEVEKYVKESATVFEGRKKSGLGFALESGFLMGDQQSENPMPFSFNFLLSLTAKTKNIVSLGSGVEFIGRSYSPVYIEYKRLIFDRKTTPFVFCRGGALTHLSQDGESSSTYPQYNTHTNYKGGVSFSAGTGISWSNQYNETYLSFAYRYFETSYKEVDYLQHETKFNNYYNRLEIKFGFKF